MGFWKAFIGPHFMSFVLSNFESPASSYPTCASKHLPFLSTLLTLQEVHLKNAFRAVNHRHD